MLATNLTLLMLPVAAFSGWYVSMRSSNKSRRKKNNHRSTIPHDYFVGLNFLVNEQPDKAVDVFVKLLEVDSETVETHLALGSLFRRRGEIERATRIHQNLIARPNLDRQMRIQSLLELGQDYLAAGVFDRAERIFQEVVASGEYLSASLGYLLDIYQQAGNWDQAIEVAQRLESTTNQSMARPIAHYYCELANYQVTAGDWDQAYRYLRKALTIDKSCARASLLLGDLEARNQRFKPAIRYFKQVAYQDADYLTETLLPLENCYVALNNKDEFMAYLYACLAEYPRISIVLLLADRISQQQGEHVAAEFIAMQLQQHPSIRGLHRLIQLHSQQAEANTRNKLHVLEQLMAKLLEEKPVYRCVQCGFSAKTLHWFCPGCRSWSTVKPIHGLEGD